MIDDSELFELVVFIIINVIGVAMLFIGIYYLLLFLHP